MAGKLSSGGGKRGQMEVNSDPNVIPFIDVMLVLLIIFMIAAPISTVDIEVNMPSSKIVPSKRPPRPTWISLSDAGGAIQVYVMNDPVAWNEIGTRTVDAIKVNSPLIANDEYEIHDQRVYIRADEDTAYRNVVRVMNRLQDEGFTKIGLVAEEGRRR